jgi:hypothetical protein
MPLLLHGKNDGIIEKEFNKYQVRMPGKASQKK